MLLRGLVGRVVSAVERRRRPGGRAHGPSLLEPSRTSPIECVEGRLRHAYRCLEAPMRRLDRDVSAASNGPWPGPLPTTHRATWRAGWRALVSRIQGRVSCAPCGTSCPEPPERIPTPRGQAREGATPLSSGRGRSRRPSSGTIRGSLPPSPCRSGGPRDSERRPLSIDLSIGLSISLSIDMSIRHHIADSIHLLLHLERAGAGDW